MVLEAYKKKRDFKGTPEPKAKVEHSEEPIFVVQKHAARRLHYDFRLEYKGVLKSWAVPKGPVMEPGEKRLAVETEDHPLKYAKFSGNIPKGHYGAGTVEIWDHGTFENVSEKDGKRIDLGAALEKGHVKVALHGKKLTTVFSLVRMREKQWLLLRERENAGKNEKLRAQKITINEKTPGQIWKIGSKKEKNEEGVVISNPEKVLFPKSKITKKEFVEYYQFIAKFMLPHMQDRPVSMYRFPDGVGGEVFFQKEVSGYSPEWIKTVKVEHHTKATKYVVCNDARTLVYLANQVIVPHLWLSRMQKLQYPDKMIFDLDPQEESVFADVALGARTLKDFFDDLNLKSFVMSTGGRGLHVALPLDGKLDFQKVGAFARVIANRLEAFDPKRFTAEQRKEKRKGKVFIDTYRNTFAQTAVAPYAVRALENAPVAAPLEWKEVHAKLDPQKVTIRNIKERMDAKGELWDTFFDTPQSLKKALEKGDK